MVLIDVRCPSCTSDDIAVKNSLISGKVWFQCNQCGANHQIVRQTAEELHELTFTITCKDLESVDKLMDFIIANQHMGVLI